MVQVLKETIRSQIIDAAEALFAKDGYKKATMGAIAEQAGIATGSIYTYFPTKKALFESIITPAFAREFSTLTTNRIAAFAAPDGMTTSQSMFSGEAGALLRFWIDHRLKVVIILSRAEGTPYEHFAREYVQGMYDQTLRQIPGQFPQFQLTDIMMFTIKQILTESVRSIVAILERYSSKDEVSKALIAGWVYQMGGINALTELACSFQEN